ncbi:WD40 repeat domain-containing protein [Microcystis aeruginosa]|uniref:Genome sequencing data, contig C312 n=1 Tax=Microcystis aeruginosa PCC 9808 TaxID=1160284 RepID=I4HFE2_MICAE|nr:WD40 repeat domain-containing protein [Microcystis aeruginosa]CCI20766.1 Genome sequencing data, contig C312 [Microcystis aeruginosa PCC 9808]
MFNRLVSFKFLEGHEGEVKCLTFSQDGKLLASAGDDGNILIWEWRKNQKFSLTKKIDEVFEDDINKIFGDLEEGISNIFGNKGGIAIPKINDMFSKPPQVKVLEIDDIFPRHRHKRINSVAFSPCQGFLVSGGDDQTLRIWSLETKKLISTLTGHQDKVTAVAVPPDGEIIASGSEDKTVKIWSVKTGEILATLQGHSDKVLTVKFSQNGQLLASGGGENDKTVIIWNLGEKSSITLKGHSDWFGGILSVDFGSNNKFLASGSKDKTIKIWDIKRGTEVKTLSEHSDHINSVSVSPNNQLLASGSDDKRLKLWDLKAGKSIISIPHPQKIYSVCFSPDGHYIATACQDKIVRVYGTSELQSLAS